ncbi:putative molybdenum carrier protein [Desulfonema magnum]|uniref:DUF6794 domain-containing protein n=1 Tax=Desulfonema magnum TaxID=45655 RepID=A0A975BP32_9BACT|nr:putative molybdenum carrier protein [Desulfonema magnum]QTA89071.1 Uncharacterized protein dnm_051190 [Desulfonema magnum]
MIKKIISGGEVGVEQAALDVAVKLGVARGGWVPKWRKIENGPFTNKYRLQEMPHANYSQATEQNVLDSDGTLIISQGELIASSALNRRFAERHKRPWACIDLNITIAFQAAQKIESWIKNHRLEVVNVTGPKEGEGLDIYKIASDILETAFQMLLIDMDRYDPFSVSDNAETKPDDFIGLPKTVENAVDALFSRLSFNERSKIANMPKEKLTGLSSSLSAYIKNEFRLWEGEDEFIKTYHPLSEDDYPDDVSLIIVTELWKKLQESDNILRVIK